MAKHLATFDPTTNAITGFYDLGVSDYASLDLSTAIEVPDDIWLNHLGKPLTVIDGVITVVVPSPPSQDALIATAKLTLAAIRYQHEIKGVLYQASGATEPSIVASDRDSQSKLIAAYILASTGKWFDGTAWKMADGSFIELTTDDAIAMSLTVQQYVAACFAYEKTLATQLTATTDQAGIEAIDLTVGWP